MDEGKEGIVYLFPSQMCYEVLDSGSVNWRVTKECRLAKGRAGDEVKGAT